MTLQSMHTMKLTLGAAAMLLWPTAALADGSAAETWNFHGKNIENTADSTGETAITTANIDDLEIEWIYNIDELQGANAVGTKTRALNFPAQGVAVDKNERIIVSTFDGRILVLNGNKMQKKPPTLTAPASRSSTASSTWLPRGAISARKTTTATTSYPTACIPRSTTTPYTRATTSTSWRAAPRGLSPS